MCIHYLALYPSVRWWNGFIEETFMGDHSASSSDRPHLRANISLLILSVSSI